MCVCVAIFKILFLTFRSLNMGCHGCSRYILSAGLGQDVGKAQALCGPCQVSCPAPPGLEQHHPVGPHAWVRRVASGWSRVVLSVTSCPWLSVSWFFGGESTFVGLFSCICWHFWVAGFFGFKTPTTKRKQSPGPVTRRRAVPWAPGPWLGCPRCGVASLHVLGGPRVSAPPGKGGETPGAIFLGVESCTVPCGRPRSAQGAGAVRGSGRHSSLVWPIAT